MTGWLDQLSARPISEIAPALGLLAMGKGTFGPCPACKADRRDQQRGAIGTTRNGLGWHCHKCDEKGSSVDLAALALVGSRLEKGDPRWRDLHEECVRRGWCTDDPASAPSATPPPPAESPRLRPAPEEVEALWEACKPVDQIGVGDPAGAFLGGRGYGPPRELAALDVVRVSPQVAEHRWPWWWPGGRAQTWRLLVRAHEADGTVASLHARAVVDVEKDQPKTLWPKGRRDKDGPVEIESGGLFFANAAGVKLLRGEAPDDVRVIVGEGLTGLVNAALRVAGWGDRGAVITSTSGGFPALAGVRFPPGAVVFAATDDGDSHGTGDKYAAEVRAAVPAHIKVKRILWNDGSPGGERDLGNVSLDEIKAAMKAAREMPIGDPAPADGNAPGADALDGIAALRKLVDDLAAAQDRSDQARLIAAFLESDAVKGLALVAEGEARAIQAALARIRAIRGLSKDAEAIERAIRDESVLAAAGERARQRPRDRRPQIEVRPELGPITREATAALVAGATSLYQRGGALAQVVRDSAAQAPAIRPVAREHLRLLMAETASWYSKRANGKDLVEVEELPPVWVVDTVATLPSWPLRHLEAVVEAPTLRRDGTLLDTPGYDQASGLLLMPPAGLVVTVSDAPGLDDAEAALALLHDVIVDFPFVADHHRSAALAAILTIVARPAIDGPVPMFLFSATTPGSGKTLLADAIGMVSTGRDLPHQSFSENDEEMRKRLTSIAVTGSPVLVLDNIASQLGGAALDSVLTSRVWTDRELGSSRMITVPWFTVMLATGNNVQVGGDLVRRVIPAYIDPGMERPEERSGFRHEDLGAYVAAHRGQLLGAALTVLRAYVAQGRPDVKLRPLGSYEAWSALVRNALVWAGEADPCRGTDELRRGGDPKRAQRAQLLEAWHGFYGDAEVFLSDVAAMFDGYRPPNPPTPNDSKIPLYRSLREIAWQRDGTVDTTRLGNFIRRAAGTQIDGLKFVQGKGRRHGAAPWAVLQ